jgi:succinoglycan biosynthesis transport protein ExoP
MKFIDYVNAVRKHWLLIGVLAIIGAGVAFGLAKTATPTYQSSSKVYVGVNTGGTIDELVQGSTFTQNLVQSYAQIVTMPVVLDPVINRLSLETDARRLAKSVRAETPLNTVIIEIKVTDSDPDRATGIANAIAAQMPKTVSALSATKTNSEATVSMTTVSRANTPQYPISPNTKLQTAIGLALGLLAGVLLALARHLLDTRLRGVEDIRQLTDVPVLGMIPAWRGQDSEKVSILRRPRSPRSESYRRLKSNLEFFKEGGARCIVVTSALPGEGKSTTAANLAAAMAEDGSRVLLVDADMRRPTLHHVTGLEGSLGLSTVLIGKAQLFGTVQPWGSTTVEVLTSGEIPPNPLQLLESRAMESLLSNARTAYDFVVIDSPPLLSLVDAAVLSRRTDGPIVVTANGRTRRKQLRAAFDTLQVADVAPIGIALTRATGGDSTSYAYYTQAERHWFSRLLQRLRPAQAAPDATPEATDLVAEPSASESR